MASTTTNIGLTKPAGIDQALISAINGNMDIIDTKMGAVGNTSVQSQITSLSDQIEKLNNVYQPLSAGNDLNDIKKTKMCYCSGVVNSPNGNNIAWGYLISLANSDETEVKQTWSYNNGNTLYCRYYRNSAWSAWEQV